MDLNSFEIYLTVVEEMSFTRAAERLYITQQSLSGHIKRLESAYHVELFRRKPTLRLTPEGEAMVTYARQILASERSMTERFAELTETAAGSLTLGISRQRCRIYFPGIWSSFHAEHRNISVRLHEYNTSRLLEELMQNQIDLMVGIDIPHSTNLTVIPLADEQLRCLINERLLEEYFPDDWQTMLERYERYGVDLVELRSLPMILPSPSNRLRIAIDTYYNQHHCAPRVILETIEHSMILQLCCYGDGIGVMNPNGMHELLRAHETLPPHCHYLPLRDMPEYRVSVAYRSDIDQPQYLLDMAECVRREFEYYHRLLQESMQ